MNKASIWKALNPEQRQRLKEVLAKKGHVNGITKARVDFVDSLSPEQRADFIKLQQLEQSTKRDNQAPKLKVKYHNGSATRPPK